MSRMMDVATRTSPLRVSVVALPDAAISTITGMNEVFNLFGVLGSFDEVVPRGPPFQVEIACGGAALTPTASGPQLEVSRPVQDVAETAVVILPSMLVRDAVSLPGRYPELVEWLRTDYPVANPVEELGRQSGVPARTFKRRFAA